MKYSPVNGMKERDIEIARWSVRDSCCTTLDDQYYNRCVWCWESMSMTRQSGDGRVAQGLVLMLGFSALFLGTLSERKLTINK